MIQPAIVSHLFTAIPSNLFADNLMLFQESKLKGAFIIDLETRENYQGYFARTFCAKEFEVHGLKPTVAQCNLSFNYKKGTLRGMHYQIAPATETKLVRCTKGAIYDVIIDLRPESPTYLQHIGVELTAKNRRALYIPEMFAHGYQTLTNEAEVICQVSEFYTPGYERGFRYNDPAFGISWPLPISEISAKDAAWPLFKPVSAGANSWLLHNQSMKCPQCESTAITKNRQRNGKLNYICRNCDRQFVASYDAECYPVEIKLQCLEMYLNGMGFRSIERLTGVDHTIINYWVNQAATPLPDAPDDSEITEVIQDKLQKFVRSKKNNK